MFEALLRPTLIEYIVLGQKDGSSFHVPAANGEKTRRVRDGLRLTSRAEEL